MIELGSYLFFNMCHMNILGYKNEDGFDYYLINSDISTDGRWMESQTLQPLLDMGHIIYVGPYIPIKPVKYIREFKFINLV